VLMEQQSLSMFVPDVFAQEKLKELTNVNDILKAGSFDRLFLCPLFSLNKKEIKRISSLIYSHIP